MRGAFGVEFCELALEFRERACCQLGAQSGIRAGEIGKPAQEGVRLHAGAADNDGHVAARENGRDAFAGEGEVLADVERLGDGNLADEMMRDACAQCARRFGREDVEAAIDLERIRADDFAATAFGHGDRDVGFSDSGRASDDEEVVGVGRQAIASVSRQPLFVTEEATARFPPRDCEKSARESRQ